MNEFDKKEGYWITINGNHIFVEKGKTVSQAFTDFLIYNDDYDKDYTQEDYEKDVSFLNNIDVPNGVFAFQTEDGRKTIEADSLAEALSKIGDETMISTINIKGDNYEKKITFNSGNHLIPRKAYIILDEVLQGKIKR